MKLLQLLSFEVNNSLQTCLLFQENPPEKTKETLSKVSKTLSFNFNSVHTLANYLKLCLVKS